MTEIDLEAREHPYLFLTGDELSRIRELARTEGTYQHARAAEAKKAADEWLEDPIDPPSRGGGPDWKHYSCSDDGHWLVFDRKKPHSHVCPNCSKEYRDEMYHGWWCRLAHHELAYAARDLALSSAIWGERRYAEEAARILVVYGDLYPTLPVRNLSKLGIEALDEVRLLVAFAAAYDLLCAVDVFSQEQRERVEEGYFRQAAEIIRVGQGGGRVDGSIGSNFQATIDAGVGLVGLLLRDSGLTEFAINGPVGFNRLMELGVLKNGMWWESSIMYHMAVLRWLLFLTEAAKRSNVDLYENAKFRWMFDVPLKMRFPDGTFPILNDGMFHVNIGEHRKNSEIYYARTGDKSVESLLIPGEITHAHNWNWAWDLSLWLEPSWEESEPSRPVSIDLSPNVAILRSVTDDPIHVVMDYGPHGGGHGHPDVLNIVVFANGRLQAPDFGSGGTYSLPEWREWYKQTVSHNTVVFDEKSQFPCTGRLNLFEISPRAKIMEASAASDSYSNEVDSDIYGHPMASLKRVVALLDESFIIDVFRVGTGRKVDWAYRNLGTLRTSEDLTPEEGALGESHGYQHIRNVRRGRATDGTWEAAWTDDDQGVQLIMVGAEDTEFITGEGFAERIDKNATMLLARRESSQTYKTVLEPFRGAPEIRNVMEIDAQWPGSYPEGSQWSGTPGTGLEIRKDTGVHYFLLGFCWGKKRFGEIESDAEVTYMAYSGKAEEGVPDYLFVVNGASISMGSFSFRADRLVTLYLQRTKEGEYILGHQNQVPSNIEIQGEEFANVNVCRLDESGHSIEEVAVSVEGGTLRLNVEPDSSYKIQL